MRRSFEVCGGGRVATRQLLLLEDQRIKGRILTVHGFRGAYKDCLPRFWS